MTIHFTEEWTDRQRHDPLLASLSAFIAHYYEQQHPQSALLFLETHYHLQPAILFVILWYATTKRGPLPKTALQTMVDHTHYWHQLITKKLSDCATSATPFTALTQLINAEKNTAHTIELFIILDHLAYGPPINKAPDDYIKDACLNLLRYCQLSDVWPHPADYNHFHQTLHPIWPQQEHIPSLFHTVLKEYDD